MDGRLKTEDHNCKPFIISLDSVCCSNSETIDNFSVLPTPTRLESRKSTHKRQKQYFEQRKRQQQQQRTAASEGYADETSVAVQHQKECRSLDILSLLNLSTVSDDGKSCLSRMDGKIEASTTTVTNSVSPSCPVKINEAGAPTSGYQEELQNPKVLFCGYDSHDLNGANNVQDVRNAATDNQLSVFDLLSDDGSEASSERSLVHEAHVAFSIEGLGKIRTETPLHSPTQEGRISSDDCSLPWNVARKLYSSKSSNGVLNDFELEVDAVMQDVDIPLCGDLSEFLMDITNSHCNWKPKISTFADQMQLDSHYRNQKCSFSDTDIFYNIRREDIGDARVSYLDDDFLHEREDNFPWKYRPCKIDGYSGDFLDYEKGEMSGDAFEGHHMLRKRDVKARKLNSLDTPSPKCSSSEFGHDFTTLIGVRHTPVQRNFDIRDLRGQLDGAFFETEDTKDNLSLPSEESCSSSAVRGETINSSPPNLMPGQNRRKTNSFGSTSVKYDVDNVFVDETHCKDRYNFGQRTGKYTRKPVLTKSKATKPASPCFRRDIGPSQTWLLEEGCNSVSIDLSFSSSRCPSEANLPSVGSKLWVEDPISAFPVPELNFDVKSYKSYFNRPKHGETIQCSPFGCFTSEKSAFFQSFNHTKSCDSPVFSKVRPGLVKHDLSPDSRERGVPMDTANPHRETGLPDLSVPGSISGDDKRKPKFLPANCKEFEFEKENCLGNNVLFSDDTMTMHGSNRNKKDLECKEAKAGTLKTKEEKKTTYSPEHGVEASSSVEIPDKCGSRGYNCDEEIPLPCQSGSEESNAKVEEGKAMSRGEKNGEESCKQVESYVEFVCVEKVVKETFASALPWT